MAPSHHSSQAYELLPRSSSDFDLDNDLLVLPKPISRLPRQASFWNWLFKFTEKLQLARRRLYLRLPSNRIGSRRLLARAVCWTATIITCILCLIVIFAATFLPSYAHLPEHYKTLEKSCRESTEPGRGNINNEKVFIAATLYDAEGILVGGEWGNTIKELIHLLGPDNVHLSVYENDPDALAQQALEGLGKQISCNASLVSEHLPLEEFPRVALLNGETRIKRMAFLSEVRNQALSPLELDPSVKFDKILFINDIIFNPIDAVQLLFSTNVDESGHVQYGAACAVDFINPFKFYDRFATRDLEGYAMGIPFFPWFTTAGQAFSRQDVLDQKDAVRVRACWGGMVAFEASWFQTLHSQFSETNDGLEMSALRFRYEHDLFWDASECCLIHADLTYLRHGLNVTTDSGIFMNPFVRVAYDSSTLWWLPYTRRVERLYPFIHDILNRVVGLPVDNPRRLEEPGDEVEEIVWEYDETAITPKGSYRKVERTVGPGRFCGSRTLQVLSENPKKGEPKWIVIEPPTLLG